MSCLFGLTLSASAHKPKPTPDKGFVVVELFTSEGCSSCPPADELVAKVQHEYQNQPVYILVYHVDYWNRLGWKDAFSNADYSKRQTDYAKSLHLESVYTPQIVVNGQKEFVGSEEGTLRNAIKAGLGKSTSAQIILSDIKSNGSQVTVNYHASSTAKYSEVVLALVQKAAQTQVKAGENQGHTLAHVQIVRDLKRSTTKNGSNILLIPKGVNPQSLEVIAFLQDTASGEIIGAAKQAISPAA